MSGAQAEADDEDFTMDGILILALFVSIIFDACGAAFIYKVWNERKQTHQYERAAAAQERIAAALEKAFP